MAKGNFHCMQLKLIVQIMSTHHSQVCPPGTRTTIYSTLKERKNNIKQENNKTAAAAEFQWKSEHKHIMRPHPTIFYIYVGQSY